MTDFFTVYFETADGRHGSIDVDLESEWDDVAKIAFADMMRESLREIRDNPCPEPAE